MYFRKIKSYQDLKDQYRELIKQNHPDNGGSEEAMKEVNVEFEALFAIWKNRRDETEQNETAATVRSKFYTQFGWEGSNHDWKRSLKEVAQIVRAYVKEKYPTWKFSVRTHYASMCEELHVEIKESPVPIYKAWEEMTENDRQETLRKMNRDGKWILRTWNQEEERQEMERIWSENGDWYKCLNDVIKAVAEDVDAFVKSYNYEDCDGMIDYFEVDFWYFSCLKENGRNIKYVPKTVRIKNTKGEKNAMAKTTKKQGTTQETAGKYTYTVKKDVDTRDNSELWVVRIEETLSKEDYIAENKAMRNRGGYYSKFKHGFIFKNDPTEILSA